MRRDRASHRDSDQCVLTHTPDPDIAHIWPFAVNNCNKNYFNAQTCFESISRGFGTSGQALYDDLSSLLAPTATLSSPIQLGISDQTWNMVAMNTQAHRWWGKAYFGLKWAGTLPGEIPGRDKRNRPVMYTRFNLEWYWLPEKIADAFQGHLTDNPANKAEHQRLVGLEDNNNEVVEKLKVLLAERRSTSISTKGALMKDNDGVSFENGRVITLVAESKDIPKTERAYKHQWLAIRMASLSGAGEAADDLDRESPYPDAGIASLPGIMNEVDLDSDEVDLDSDESQLQNAQA